MKSNASIKSPKTQRSIVDAASHGGLPEIDDLPDPMGSKADLRSHRNKKNSPYKEADLRKMMNSPEMRQVSQTWMGAFYN